jgi:ATP-dependent DNA ligase
MSARLEGIVSKRQGSFYESGPSRNWLKAKNPNRSLPEIQRVR